MTDQSQHKSYKFTFTGYDFPSLNKALDLAKRALRVRKNKYKNRTYVGSMYDVQKAKLCKLIAEDAKTQHDIILTKQYMIVFCWYSKDIRRDPDNIEHGQKYILDGLVRAGILPNDGIKNVGGGKVHAFFKDKSNPRVEVTFIEGNFNDYLRSTPKRL